MPLAAPDLDAAFEACRLETAEWAKTFYIGTLLLPPEKRRAIWAIYVWCRRTDELMDSPEAQSRPVEELAERLARRHLRGRVRGCRVERPHRRSVHTRGARHAASAERAAQMCAPA